jgi:gliding motility associated protien GldN
MAIKYLKYTLTTVLVLNLLYVHAQQRPVKKRPTSAYGNTQQNNPPANNQQRNNTSGYGNDTTVNPASSDYGNANNPSAGIDTTLPITVIKSSGNGLLDSTKMSLRNDGAVERNLVKDRTPLTYEDIREDDAVFMVRVWREIDAREKINLPFRYSAVEDNGSQRFISILLRAISNGDVTAFNGEDDRFTTPITADEAMNAFGGGYDTAKVFDADGNVVGYQVRAKATDPDSIYKFRIKEEWIFDKESSRMFVRIIGVAPVIPFKLSTGDIIANSDRPVWWVIILTCGRSLQNTRCTIRKNIGAQMTWEELFESRMFSSYIVKSSIDNPFDIDLATVYPNNTLFRLLTGEKIKTRF